MSYRTRRMRVEFCRRFTQVQEARPALTAPLTGEMAERMSAGERNSGPKERAGGCLLSSLREAKRSSKIGLLP